jgi:hypothetical protein
LKEKDTKRNVEYFREVDIKLLIKILNKTRDIYSFFKYLKEKKDSSFTMVLIKSETLRESILKEKRKTDVFVDLDIADMNLLFLPVAKKQENDGLTKRMMSGVQEGSGDFACIVGVQKKADLEETIFTLLVDYFMILKQPLEWRTGQISYKEV